MATCFWKFPEIHQYRSKVEKVKLLLIVDGKKVNRAPARCGILQCRKSWQGKPTEYEWTATEALFYGLELDFLTLTVDFDGIEIRADT